MPVGGTAIGSGAMPSFGSTGLTVTCVVAVPAALDILMVCAPRMAVAVAVRLNVICVGVTCIAETSRPGSDVVTCAPVRAVPVICTVFVSPRLMDAGVDAVITGGCALPAPETMTWRMLPAAS
ncbi:MAG TPA: hypothetical protein VF110_09980 [Burkholderiales bacterium]